MRKLPLYKSPPGVGQDQYSSLHPGQGFGPLQSVNHLIPVATDCFHAQRGSGPLTPCRQPHTPFASPDRVHKNTGTGLSASPQRPAVSPTEFRAQQTAHINRLVLQLQTTRQQARAHELEMLARHGPRSNGPLASPVHFAGISNLDAQKTGSASDVRNAVSTFAFSKSVGLS